MKKIYGAVGGRKQFNGLLGTVLLTMMAFLLEAEFPDYAMWLSVFLLGVGATNVWQKRTANGTSHETRVTDGEPA
jgi:hypothetical protein